MRKLSVLCLVALVCGGVAVVAAQKKPANRQPMKIEPPAQRGASPEENKRVARRVFDELFTQGRYGEIDQIYSRDCRVHFGGRTERLDDSVTEGKGWRSAAPDLVMTADQVSVNGDMVTVVWTARGTHTGQGHGLKPTGKRINMRGKSEFRVVNGKIVEVWNEDYRPELFRQLGVPRTQAWLFEKGEDIWLAARDFFSREEPASTSVQTSAQ